MHLVHLRITTTFQNQTFLRIRDFQGFPYSRLCRFVHILGMNISNFLSDNGQGVLKNEKHFEIFKSILNFPRMNFGHPRTITIFKNKHFFKIWGFQGFPYSRLDHFGLMFGLKIFKPLQKMAKEWLKI